MQKNFKVQNHRVSSPRWDLTRFNVRLITIVSGRWTQIWSCQAARWNTFTVGNCTLWWNGNPLVRRTLTQYVTMTKARHPNLQFIYTTSFATFEPAVGLWRRARSNIKRVQTAISFWISSYPCCVLEDSENFTAAGKRVWVFKRLARLCTKSEISYVVPSVQLPSKIHPRS